jgi:hypothetical protein
MSNTELIGAILDGMARGVFVQWYASEMEEEDPRIPEGMPREKAGAGEDWMDVAPETPTEAFTWARRYAVRLAEANGLGCALPLAGVVPLLRKATEADGQAWPPPAEYAAEFGHYLAMQGVGHGVSWFDDHADFEIEIPHSEFYL